MRIDKVYIENRLIIYSKEDALSVSPKERYAGNAPFVPGHNSLLLMLYKRYEINDTEACTVNLSLRDAEVSEEAQPVLCGVFDLNIREKNQREYGFSSWVRTVNSIQRREVRKGVYIDKVV